MNHPAQLRPEGQVAGSDCQIFDLSLKGVKLAAKVKLAVDRFVQLCIVLHPEFTINAEVWVAWSRPAGRHTVYGLYFHRIKDADKELIYRFFCRFFPERIKQQMRNGLHRKEENMQEEKVDDRRIFSRFPARMPLRLLRADDDHQIEAETSDISAKGIGLLSAEEVNPDSELEVWLQVTDKGEPFYSRGRVVWVRTADPGMFRMGINLEKADLVGLSHVLRQAKTL